MCFDAFDIVLPWLDKKEFVPTVLCTTEPRRGNVRAIRSQRASVVAKRWRHDLRGIAKEFQVVKANVSANWRLRLVVEPKCRSILGRAQLRFIGSIWIL